MNLDDHYKANRGKLVKRFTFRSGSEFDAEDIVQDAYARALKYSQSYRDEGFDRWFNMVLLNAYRDFQRNEKGRSNIELDEEIIDGTECTHYSDRVVEEIHALIDTKSVNQIEVLNMYWKQEYSVIDISKNVDMPYITCYQMIRRFKQELQELYG